MSNHIVLTFSDDTLTTSYVSDGESMLSFSYPYGYKYLESHTLGLHAVSSLDSVLLSLCEQISLYDRIPLDIHVDSFRHREWLKRFLESRSYTQFYTEHKPFRVTLLDTVGTSLSYARHSQTINTFKI